MRDINASEVWLPIPDWPHYQVSDQGRVWVARRPAKGAGRRWLRERMLSITPVKDGYRAVTLGRSDGYRRLMPVHQLVLAAFVGPCPRKHEVRHLDGDPTNNQLGNLKYGTHRENMADMIKHGRGCLGRSQAS